MKIVMRDSGYEMRDSGCEIRAALRRSVSVLCVIFFPILIFSSSLDGEESVGAHVLSYGETIAHFAPMGLSGVDERVADVLRGYYQHSLGGRASWKKVESIRFDGVLRLPEGSLRFYAFLKKPDYCKMVLVTSDESDPIVMAYDGADAWQIMPHLSPEPVAMPPVEALAFIRDAVLGGHLLYPTLPGKTIELVETRRVDGNLFHDLEVTLPNGQKINYLIDAITFEERQSIVVNELTGDREVTTHSELRKIARVSIPFTSTMTVDGEFVHEVQLSAARVNLGVMPWMFKRPSGAYIPGLDLDLDAPVEEARGESDVLEFSPSFGQPKFEDPKEMPSVLKLEFR